MQRAFRRLLARQRARGPHGAAHGQRVLYGTRPEHWRIDGTPDGLPAQVIVVEPTGAETQVALRVGGQDVLAAFRERVGLASGDRLSLRPDAAQAHLFDADSGARLN